MFDRSRRALALTLLLALIAVAGCGQTGPLYLPEPETPAPKAVNPE